MEEKYIQDLYNELGGQEKFGSFEDFKTLITTDENYQKDFYDSFGESTLGKFNDFISLVKKKGDTTVLPSEDGSLESQEVVFSEPKPQPQQLPASNQTEPPDVVLEKEEEEESFGSYLINALDVGVSTVSKSIYDLPSIIYDSAAFFTNPIARLLGAEEASSEKFAKTYGLKNIPSEIVGKHIQEKSKEIQEYNDKNGGDAFTALENGNVLGSAKMIAGTTVQSLPLMSVAFMTGGSNLGMGVVATSTASTKAAQLKEENPEMDVNDRTLNAVTSGMLEATLGQLLTGASGAVTKKILINEGSKKGAKIITDSFKSVLENTIEKSPLLPLFGEVLEESLVSVGEQLIDISTGVKTDFDMKEVINSGLSATGMGGVNTVAIYGAKGYVSSKDYVKLKKINKDLSKLSDEVLASNLPDEEKDLLNKSIERLKSQGKKVVDDAKNKVSLLPEEARKELDNTILNLDGISISAFKIKSNKDLSDEVKKAMLNELKFQAIELTDKKNKILSKEYKLNEFETLPDNEKLKLKEEASKILLKEAQDQGQTNINITDNQISKKAFEIYNNKEKAPLSNQEIARKNKLEEVLSNTKENLITIDGSVLSREDAVNELQQLNKKEIDAVQTPFETDKVSTERIERISELNSLLASDAASLQETGTGNLLPEARQEVQQELETLKSEQSAFETLAEETPQAGTEVVTETQTIIESLNDVGAVFVYDGKKGQLTTIGQTVVLETPTEIIDLGNVDELSDSTLDDFGIQKEQELNIQLNKDNSVVVNENTYLNNYSNPDSAISQDKDGNYSVTLDTENGQKRTFRGQQAEQIVYQMKLKNFEQNGTEQDIDAAIELANEAIRIEEEVGQPSPEREGKSVRKGKRKQRTLKTVKESLAKIEKQDETRQQPTVQPQRTRDGGTRRTPISKTTPLKGAPKVEGATGPDQQLVSVAEKYAAENGIDLKRQGEYVEVDEKRAKRIADAYEAMENNPQNPKVKEAYAELIKQTKAQYQALVDAGYKFWFIDLNNSENIDYISSPYNAMRDLRQNKQIGVFPTEEGFGSNEDVDVSQNPLLEDTGIEWAVGGLDGEMKSVTANDLFRAVHDAFGHGLEGAGFRARGEENAFQAHSRLYTGAAIGAMASETRGQNSWVNYGPKGEQNRTASAEDTVFADQKVGLMPDFTWTEGLAGDMQTEASVEEDVQVRLDELVRLDPTEKGTAKKVLDGLDKMIGDIENFEKGTLGVNIALPIMKNILKGIRALVQAGVAIKDAIKKVAKDNNVTVKQVVDGINAVSQILPIQAEYNALMKKADKLIANQKSRGIAEKKIVSNLDTMIRNSEVYKNANDAQRKIMEREARLKMGVGPRKAASIGRVIGVLKDITNVSRKEKFQIISRIRALSKGVAKDLAQEIRALAKEGKITTAQSANVIAKFGKVNLLNEMSVSNFVDYMAKVFADAEYDNKIKVAKSKLSKARKSIATKIGISDGLMLSLKKLFAINPSLIPDSSLERYLELLNMFSANQQVLTLEQRDVVKADVDAILNEINNEQSKADVLAEIFNNSDNRVFEDGELDYAASLKNMIKEEDITNEDAEVMRKYKQNILPQVEKSPLSEQEISEKKEEYIKALKQMAVSGDGLPSQDERNLAKRLAELISDTPIEILMKLGVNDLKNLLKVADNINNDYLPHYAQIMVEKINGLNNGKVIANSVKKAKPLAFSALYSKLKAVVIRSRKGGIAEMVRRNPLFVIDQVFGDFKTKDIFNALFAKTAEAEASFKSELKKVQTILENAEAKVAKSFKLNPDETLMSKFKMMTYMIQLEYESNVGSQQVNSASEYLKATIKHIDEGKSRFGERDANMLKEVLDKYAADGEIDIEKLFNSFNKAEKDAIKAIRGINESLKDKAQYTAAIIRGDAIDPLNNYVHLNVLHDTEALDVSAATDFLNQANNSRKPSTKAKSLISRTKGAKPLNFDVFTSAHRGAKFVILDYHLTEPIRTARRTMNQATADLEANGRIPKQQREIKNAIDFAFEEAVENLLTNSILQNSLADEAIDFISKQGYRAVLAGTGRFAAELTSNITFAVLADPKSFSLGTKYKGFIMSTDAPLVMENVNSKQTNRVFPSDTLSGKFIDTSILSQASGIQSASSKNPVFNKMQQIWNLSGKKYQNVVELTADALISTPDKLVMRPMWFGSFANEFKKITGVDVDFKKIASNDQAYMDANKDAIKQSKEEADNKSVMMGATDNSFMGILKGTIKPNQSLSTRAFNNFNNYMTRFLIFEYVTARTAIYAMVGNGTLSKRQGAAMLAAVATRMTVYTLLSQMLANVIMGLFGIEEEEEDEKSLMQKIGRALVSTFTSLLIGRDFGNATKLVINYGLEEVNEEFLDFLREGEYDPYKDGISYSIIPRDGKDNELGKLLMNMGGSFGPALNTASLIYKNRKGIPAVLSGGTTKKEIDAIEREERVVKERIPLELLGHAGLIPLYKDVRNLVNKSIYASIKEAEAAVELKKQRAKDLLGGYKNKTDLKRYDPKLYEKNFGKGSEWYESTKEEREAKLKEAKEEREMKDKMYNYTKKGGFGSKKFESKKFGSGSFGSKKFGGN